MPKSNNKRKNGKVAEQKSRAPVVPIRVSARAHAKNNEQNIVALAQDIQNLARGVQQAVNQLEQQIHQVRTILGAVVAVLDIQQKVESKLVADKRAAQTKAADDAKLGLEKLIAQKIVVPATTIIEGALIVGRETDKEGTIIHPGRVQLQVGDGMVPEVKSQLLGQPVGFKFNPSTDKTFEVMEIYTIDAEQLAKVQEEEQAKAQAAAEKALAEAQKNAEPKVADAPAK